MSPLEVSLAIPKRRFRPGERIPVTCIITNRSAQDIQVVRGPVTLSTRRPKRLDVSIAETPAPKHLFYYAYVPPALQPLGAGAKMKRRVTAALLAQHPTHSGSRRGAAPATGRITLQISVGYGTGPFAPITTDPWGEFMRWQQVVRSPRFEVVVR